MMRYLILLAALALGACSQAPVKAPANDVASLGSITDLHSGATLTPEQLLTRLARQPRVILGRSMTILITIRLSNGWCSGCRCGGRRAAC